jgi:hypothetical protein
MDTVSLFLRTPPSICVSNNRWAVNHSEFVVEAIHDLLIKVMIEECESKPIVVNPLTVSVSSSNKQTFKSRFETCEFTFMENLFKIRRYSNSYEIYY